MNGLKNLKRNKIMENKVPYYKWCYGKFIFVGYVEKNDNIL